MTRYVFVLALAACGSGEAPRDEELDGARAQVQTFFDAVAKRDCATLGALLPAAAGEASCAKLLHEWSEDLHLRLIDLTDARRDGRDRRAIIVRATVWRNNAQTTMLVRVTHEEGTWQLAL